MIFSEKLSPWQISFDVSETIRAHTMVNTSLDGYWVLIENVGLWNNTWKIAGNHKCFLSFLLSPLCPPWQFFEGMSPPPALPSLHVKGWGDRRVRFSGERTLKAKPRALSREPGKCLHSQPEPGSRSINCPVLQIKEPGPKAENHLSWMWGRKKELKIRLPKTLQHWSFSFRSSNDRLRFQSDNCCLLFPVCKHSQEESRSC